MTRRDLRDDVVYQGVNLNRSALQRIRTVVIARFFPLLIAFSHYFCPQLGTECTAPLGLATDVRRETVTSLACVNLRRLIAEREKASSEERERDGVIHFVWWQVALELLRRCLIITRHCQMQEPPLFVMVWIPLLNALYLSLSPSLSLSRLDLYLKLTDTILLLHRSLIVLHNNKERYSGKAPIFRKWNYFSPSLLPSSRKNILFFEVLCVVLYV